VFIHDLTKSSFTLPFRILYEDCAKTQDCPFLKAG
jgi:hypothetical protein